jgi:predicted transcriptional regulator
MTGAEIVAAVQEAGHNVSEGNIRTSISRVKDKKLIVSRHNKWFPL